MTRKSRRKRNWERTIAWTCATVFTITGFIVVLGRLHARDQRIKAKWGGAYSVTLVHRTAVKQVNILDNGYVTTQLVRDYFVKMSQPAGPVRFATIELPVGKPLATKLWHNSKNQLTSNNDYWHRSSNLSMAVLLGLLSGFAGYFGAYLLMVTSYSLAALALWSRRVYRRRLQSG